MSRSEGRCNAHIIPVQEGTSYMGCSPDNTDSQLCKDTQEDGKEILPWHPSGARRMGDVT